MIQINVKERAEALASQMTNEQQAAVGALGNELHRLNQLVVTCVESGLSIELHRTARHHTEGGFWGDLVVPVITKHGRRDLTVEYLEPGFAIERNMKRACEIRSRHCRKLLRHMTRWVAQSIATVRKAQRSKVPAETSVGQPHPSGF